MAGYTAGIAQGFFEAWKQILLSIEQEIPPGTRMRGGKIDKETTWKLRTFLSERNTERLVELEEDDYGGHKDGASHAACFDDHAFEFEDVTTDLLGSTTDAQNALQWFYDTLRTRWPICSHHAMLRLVADRQGTSEEENATPMFQFDTLSSTHSEYWGRIMFQAKVPRRPLKVGFEGFTDGENHELETPPLDLCPIIERSGNERVFSVVDLTHGTHTEPRGGRLVKSSKKMIALDNLLNRSITKPPGREADSTSLTIHEKADLAVVFACSLLQLSKDSWGNESQHEGPWLQRNWQDSGIRFLPNHRGKPRLDEPYLPILINEPTPVSTMPYPPPSFVALALTLLQLQGHEDEVIEEFNSIRKTHVAEDNGVVTDSTDYYALLDLLDTNAFEVGIDDQYKRAITACLKGRIVDAVWREDEWIVQQYFSQDIIVPLKDYLKKLELSAGSSVQPQHAERDWNFLADSEEEKHQVDSRQAIHSDAWFNKFEKKVHELVKLEPGHDSKAPIKIAVLDTGLEFPPEADVLYEDQIMGRRSWVHCYGRNHFKLEHARKDLDGHGTHCVSVVLKVAQNAHIYVARVFEARSQRTVETEVRTQAIIEALTCAIDEWEVDIITMSFGCSDRVDEIDNVMKRAQDKGIIMIAAASNSGALEPISWPARSDRVIAVHALDGYGNCSAFTPNAQSHEHNFAAPGVAVLGYWPKNLGMVERRMTGTSCAAPVVAGIVAVLLEFVRKHEAQLFDEDKEILKKLRERQGIITILDKMGSRNQRNGYEFLTPWEFLDSESKYDDDQSRMKAILKALNAAG